MPPVVLDLAIAAMVLLITYVIASEGAWGAALMFFNVLFAAMIAFNFYEPLAEVLAKNLPNIIADFSDMVCMLGIFTITLVLMRIITETLAPSMIRLPAAVYHVGRVAFGLGTALVTIGIVILAFHAAPIHKKLFGALNFDHKPPFGLGLDMEWLAFFQRASENAFVRYGDAGGDAVAQKPHIFDREGRWLIDHQLYRQFGEGPVIDLPSSGGESADSEQGQGGGQGQGAGGF